MSFASDKDNSSGIPGLSSFQQGDSSPLPASAVNPPTGSEKESGGSNPGRRDGFLFLVYFIAAAVAIAVMLTQLVDQRVKDGPVYPDSTFPGQTSTGSSGGGGSSDGIGSLIKQGNFSKALGKVENTVGSNSKVVTLRLDNDLLSVVADTKDGGQVVSVSQSLDVSNGDAGNVSVPGAQPLSKISTAAPQRAVRGVASKSSSSAKDVDYLVYGTNPVTKKGYWNIYIEDGQGYWAANSQGRNVEPMAGAK